MPFTCIFHLNDASAEGCGDSDSPSGSVLTPVDKEGMLTVATMGENVQVHRLSRIRARGRENCLWREVASGNSLSVAILRFKRTSEPRPVLWALHRNPYRLYGQKLNPDSRT